MKKIIKSIWLILIEELISEVLDKVSNLSPSLPTLLSTLPSNELLLSSSFKVIETLSGSNVSSICRFSFICVGRKMAQNWHRFAYGKRI